MNRSMSFSRSSRFAFATGVALIVFALTACGGGKSKTPASADDISGTYTLVQDSDGSTPKDGVTVTLTLDNGTLSVRAVSADDELTDTGTYSIRDGRMTITFEGQGISATDQPYTLTGDTLEIPVMMFGEGEGSSTWQRSGGQAARPTSEPAKSVKSDWSRADLSKDAAAAATKQFVEAVNGGTDWETAVTEAAQFARGLSDVADATVSPNGLNITIRYSDGSRDYVITERMELNDAASAASFAPAADRLVSAQPVAESRTRDAAAVGTAADCAALPASPSADIRSPEPGREGLNPAGGYGVAVYDARIQPKPINSADTPPKRALLVAPVYELDHPLRGGGKTILYESFKSALGSTIECVQSDLTGAGYTVDTIIGTTQGGKPVRTGDQAVEEFAKSLATNKYGVLYVLSHGANLDYGQPPSNQSLIYMGLLNLDRSELKKAVNGRKLTPDTRADVVKALVSLSGLTWDGSGDAPFLVGFEFNGSAVVWVTPKFFTLLRTQKSVSFDKTLVFLNLCSSGAGSSLKDALSPRAFFGWAVPVDSVFAADAAETIFDSLTDKARSARNAWTMWRRHEAWKITNESTPRPDNAKPDQLRASGVGGVEYPGITSQSVLLIYRLRAGPSSATADITQSISMVRNCSTTFWSSGTSTGLKSPACHSLELGNNLPKDAEVADAIFEVGGGGSLPFGRWTLAD